MFFKKVGQYIERHKKEIGILAILFPLLVLFFYFYCIVKYSINFPLLDDYHAGLEFIEIYNEKQSFFESFLLIFKQHNEHRIAFDRIAFISQYKLFNNVNFKTLIIIGNVSLIFIIAILYKSVLYKKNINLFYFIPVSLLVLNFRYYEVSFWAMASLQNMWVLVFAMTSLYFLYQETKYAIYISITLASIATVTSGNGMLTFVAGIIVLFLNKNFFNYKTILWALSGIIAISLYFYGYISPAHHPSIVDTILHPFNLFAYIFVFLGGSPNLLTAFIVGLILILFSIYITFKKFYKENPVLYSYIVFFILTAGIVALGRAGFGIDQATSPRYIINASVFSAICYLVFISIFNEKIKPVQFCLLTVVFFYLHINSYKESLPKQIEYKKEFDKNFNLITKGFPSSFNFGWPLPDKSEAKKILKTSDSTGVFKFKFEEDSVIAKIIISKPESNNKSEFHIDHFEYKKTGEVLISGWAFLKGENSSKIGMVISIRDSADQDIYMCFPVNQYRPEVNEVLKVYDSDYSLAGFSADIITKGLKPGKYKLILFLTDGKIKKEIDTQNYFIKE